MSTRCNIIIRGNAGNQIILYHHHDGYPEGVGSYLLDFCTKLAEKSWYMNYTEIATWLVKNGLFIANENGRIKHDNEYKITDSVSGDAEYLYVLHVHPFAKPKPIYKVLCYDVRSWSKNLNKRVDIPSLEKQQMYIDFKQTLQESVQSPELKFYYKTKLEDSRMILFRCRDFYITLCEDAVQASSILGITLRKSSKTREINGGMLRSAAFPYYRLDEYMPRLIRAGKHLMIYDLLSKL